MKRFLPLLLALLSAYVSCFSAPVVGDGDTLWTKPWYNLTDIKFHPSGNTLFVTQEDNEFFELDAQTGEMVHKYKHPLEDHTLSRPKHFDINKAGTQVASIHNDTVFIWDYQTKNIIKRIYKKSIAVFFGNNDKYLYSLRPSSDFNIQNVWIYNIENDEFVIDSGFAVNKEIFLTAIAVSSNGKYMALASFNKENLCSNAAIFDALSFKHIADIVKCEFGSNQIQSFEFSEDSKWVAVKAPFFSSKIINVEEVINNGNKIEYTYPTSGVYFINVKDKIFIRAEQPKREFYCTNFDSQDTTYIINLGVSKLTLDNNLNKIALLGMKEGEGSYKLYMFDSNWYNVGIESINNESDRISLVEYNSGILSYKSNIEDISSVIVYNILGKEIFRFSSYYKSNDSINFELLSGAYILVLSDGRNNFSKKFVVR